MSFIHCLESENNEILVWMNLGRSDEHLCKLVAVASENFCMKGSPAFGRALRM